MITQQLWPTGHSMNLSCDAILLIVPTTLLKTEGHTFYKACPSIFTATGIITNYIKEHKSSDIF